MKEYLTSLINYHLQLTPCLKVVVKKCLDSYQVPSIFVIIDSGRYCQVENPAQGIVHIRMGINYIHKICELCSNRFVKKSDDILRDINLEDVSIEKFLIKSNLQQNSTIQLPHIETEAAAYFVHAIAFAIFHELGHMYMKNIGVRSQENEIISDVFAVCLIKESTLDIQKAIEGCMLDLNCISTLQQNVVDDEHPTIEKRQSIVSLLQDDKIKTEDIAKIYKTIQDGFKNLIADE